MKTIHSLTTFMLIVGLVLAIGPVRAASSTTITVDTTVDDNAANGNCTLREAIIAANTDAAVDQCPAGSGSDTIVLPSASYVLTVGGAIEDAAATGDLDITDTAGSLTLVGAGAGVTVIDAASVDRVFDVFAGVILNVSGVKITGGSVPGTGPSGLGGGIRNQGGTVTIVDSILSTNAAGNAGAIWNTGGTVTIANSMLSGNAAQYNAGGIYNDGGGTVILTQSTISANTAGSLGGGICQYWGTVAISKSTITGNSASGGGGIYNVNPGTVVTIDNSTITGNTAVGQGGGVSNGNDGTLTVTSSTITGNTANTDGGGIFNEEYGMAELTNTIVAAQLLGGDCSGIPVSSLGHNLDSDGTCGLAGSGDISGSDPLLGPLDDNGGPTETHALLPDSPAIDAGDDSVCPDTDQRGEPRPVDGDGDGLATCDIGAYEYLPAEAIILPYIDGRDYTIYPGQVGVIVQGWGAATPGLVRVWIEASNHDLVLYDETGAVIRHLTQEQISQLWGPIVPRPDLMEQCLMRPRTSSAVWRHVLPSLAPGTYELHSRTWIDHPLTDGCDSIDGDGRPDIFYPDTYVLETVNTIIITDN